MKKMCIAVLISLFLLSACKSNAPVSEGIQVVSCSQEEAEASVFSISYYTLPGENDWPQTFSKAFQFEGLRETKYDTFQEPFRFDDDKSVWATYDRIEISFNSIVGRCISSEEDVDFIRRTLIDREYQKDSDASAEYFTPRFELRQGKDCSRCSDRFPEGVSFDIDNVVFRYLIRPDGTVIRMQGDELESSVSALPPEDTARLYLIYEAYYCAREIFSLGPSPYEDAQAYALYVERDGKRLRIPADRLTDFLSLVTVEEDHLYPDEPRCCAIANIIYAEKGYASPEVLRFLVCPSDSDILSYPTDRWFSLREDGRIVRSISSSAGVLWPNTNRWTVHVPILHISKASFDVSAITALVDECQ